MTPDRPLAGARRPYLAVLHVALVYVAVRAFWMVSALPEVSRQPPIVDTLTKIGLWVIPCLFFSVLTVRQSPRAWWREVGLGGPPWRGVAFGLAATTPMAIAVAFSPVSAAEVADFDVMLDSVLVGPFTEEVLFRGFLCFQLVRFAGWRIGPAIAVSSTMFALAHLPHVDLWFVEVLRGPAAMGVQAIGDGERLLMVRAPADVWLQFVARRADDLLLYGAPYALGGALFAWIAWRWQSLWPAVALHAAMNLWWVLAEGGSRLQFGVTPMTVAHALAIALAIALTFGLSRLRRRGRPLLHGFAPPSDQPGESIEV